MPFHLLFPLAASLLFALAMMFLKRCSDLGVGVMRATFVTNMMIVVGFGTLKIGAEPLSLDMPYWQPAIVALMFLGGQTFQLLSIHRGDVSLATPVFGLKIVLVAALTLLLTNESVGGLVWLAAILSTLAIVLLNRSGGQSEHRNVKQTLLLALLASILFALFDVLVTKWSPGWGTGRFLPVLFAFVGLYSFGLIPFFEGRLSDINRSQLRWLLAGGSLVVLQAMFMVAGLSMFGEATAMNVVFSLRGLWSIGLVWFVGHWFHNAERDQGGRVFAWRLSGCVLLTLAIVLVLLA